MELNPIARAGTVSDAVFARLIEEILSGRWPADRPAPSERELALALQVNRHSVREALKRLQQAGLVQIGQGGKTLVLDWRSNAGLDMLAALTATGVVPVVAAVLDTAVMRRTVGTHAARLCALRADEQQLAQVSAAAAAYPESGDANTYRDADLELWTAIIIGSGNITYRLALNTLVRAIDEIGREFYVNLDANAFMDRPIHMDLAAAITSRDAELAGTIAYKSLSPLINMLSPVDPG